MKELVLHVGQMKSGTTYLQEIMSVNRLNLAKGGWEYPGKRLNQQHACYSLCGKDIPWIKSEYPAKLGQDLVASIQRSSKNVLVSSEALSTLSRNGIVSLIEKVGNPEKVIFTIRPLITTLPSAWQQYLKGGGRTSFTQFLKKLDEQREGLAGFWRTYAYGNAIKKWSEFASVKVVVAPGKDCRKDALWELFSEAVGLPKVDLDGMQMEKANVSLPIEVCEVLLRMNRILEKQDPNSEKIRKDILERLFFPYSKHAEGGRIGVPAKCIDMVAQWNQEELELLNQYSERIYGDENSLIVGSEVIVSEPTLKTVSDVMARILVENQRNI